MIGCSKPTILRSERGSMALEYGLLLPALTLMLFVAMDTGRLMWTYTTLHRAVEASARCAAINPSVCGTVEQIAERAVAEAWGLGLTVENFTAQTQSCGAEVTANYQFPVLVPWLGQNEPPGPTGLTTLSVSACYPL